MGSGWPVLDRPGCLTTATSPVYTNPTGQNSTELCDPPPSRDVSRNSTQVGTDEAPPCPPYPTNPPRNSPPTPLPSTTDTPGPCLSLPACIHPSDPGQIVTTVTSTTRSWTTR